MKKLFAITFLTLAFSALWMGTALAQQPTPSDDDVNAIAKQLFCPVCENTPLDVCPTQACAQWRDLIRLKLSEGWTEAQIKQYFADQYGARVLSEPPRQGLYWLVYIVPPALFLVGVYILFRAFQSWRKPVPAETEAEVVSTPVANDDYLRRVEEELKKKN